MLIRTYTMDNNAQATLVAETQVDALRLLITAESREEEARRRGRTWTAGAVPFFAQELITASQKGKPQKSIEMEAVNVAMAAWLCDSIFDGVTADTFVKSDLVFTLLPSGAVKYDRIPILAI